MLTREELLRIPLFASLGPDELDYLARSVPDIHVAAGDYVVHEGEGRALVIVVDGRLAAIKVIDGEDRIIGYRVPGTLFHTLAAAAPQISATLGAAAVERIGGLQNLAKSPTRAELFVIGPRFSPAVQALRTFLHRNHIEFEWRAESAPSAKYPIVKLPDGTELVEPSVQTLAKAVGLSIAPSRDQYDVVIIGGGPAGMAAAVYGASEGLRTMLVEREAPGGQAGTSSRIENYLGFPFGVSGDDLATRALQQARRLGAEIVVTRTVETFELATRTLTLDGGTTLKARTLVLATGVAWRRLAIESIDRFTGRGVFYGAARSEASATQGRDVFLIGAGNSAGQAALFFASYARTVTLVVRGDALSKSMSHYLIQQLQTKPNVRVELRSEVVGVHGGEQLEEIDIVDRGTGVTRRVAAGGLFVFIGADASTEWLPAEIARDSKGYVLTGLDAARSGRWTGDREPFLLETTAQGVFAVGDVRSGSVKRVASAVGDGSLAITFVRQHLDALTPD